MPSFCQPGLAATAKVLSLVRLHHGLPSLGGEEIPLTSEKRQTALGRVWKRGSRLNHLVARRRRIALDEIPVASFPAILELSKGSNFVVLMEKHSGGNGKGDRYLVQFPDSRESLVSGDRLRELYDGVCVFLRPAETEGGRGGFLRRFRARRGASA